MDKFISLEKKNANFFENLAKKESEETNESYDVKEIEEINDLEEMKVEEKQSEVKDTNEVKDTEEMKVEEKQSEVNDTNEVKDTEEMKVEEKKDIKVIPVDYTKDFEKIEKRQQDKIKKDELLLRIFKILNYEVNSIKELTSITLQREMLRGKQITEKILQLVPELREVYNSSYLTCLHDNSIYKQKNPVINLVRQVLKCNHLLMTPKVVSNGYDKASGKKLVTRIFVIEKELF